MNFKKLTAFAVVTTMVLGSSITAFADGGVDGAGAVEYDNSVDVSYDSITVPTLVGTTYNFQLDPRDELHTFDSDTYAREAGASNPGVYFHSQKSGGGAKIEKSDAQNAVDIYKLEKKEVTSGAADWKAVVTAVNSDGEATTVTAGFYVWTPAEFAAGDVVTGTTTAGKKGVFTELNASNVGTYFEIGEADSDGKYEITMKANHLAGATVCDGKLYKDTYTAITTAIQDNPPTVDLKEYVELETDGKSIKTVKEVYKANSDNTGYVKAEVSDIKFTAANIVYQNVTDKVVVVNKSTKKKTVKAVVTMSNVDGLSFNDSDDFTDVKTASVFFKATDGTADNDAVLTKGETTATATYTLDVEGANVKSTQIKYQGGTNPKTGGHNYYNYPAFGTTYNSNSFWLVGNANTNADDDSKAAWKAYGEALEAAYDSETTTAATPKINIVYTVTDYQEAPSSYTVTFNSNGGSDVTAQTVNAGGKATEPETNPTKAGKNFGGWYADSELTTAFDFENTTIDAATTIYAKWNDPTEAGIYYDSSKNEWWIGITDSEGFAADATIDSVKCNGSAVESSVGTYGGKKFVVVSWNNYKDAGLDQSATTYEFLVSVDGVYYTATHTH
jgi:hypothetical protein